MASLLSMSLITVDRCIVCGFAHVYK